MKTRHLLFLTLMTALALSLLPTTVPAHPLGQFTINQFARIETGIDKVTVHYVVDLAELVAFQELQRADTDSSGALSEAESQAYLERTLAQILSELKLTADGHPVTFSVTDRNLALRPGTADLPTLMITCNLTGSLPPGSAGIVRKFRFENNSFADRQGWRELVVVPGTGISIFDSTIFGNGITAELQAYPEDLLQAPLNERVGEWSATTGTPPAAAKALMTRAGKPVVAQRDRFAELIAVKTITPGFALFALLFAFVLGGAHALSPGHGKTVVGAYLVGSKGTAKHAAFLGLTVTITHTLGVYALGLITLFASHYIVPEKLYPILSLASGVIVLVIGLGLFTQRIRAAFGMAAHDHHEHQHSREHSHEHLHDHAHHHANDHAHETTADRHAHMHGLTHSHGGKEHTHLPPDEVSWRNLLALGISGGLLPCPSALVVMLSAIVLQRVGFGLVLIVAFSLGLACVLTAIGLAFVYAGKFINTESESNGLLQKASRVLPILSALVVAVLGGVLIWQALVQAGINFSELLATTEPTGKLTTLSALTLGLILGLKHAVEADHLAAVTTIVSERKSILSSTLVGGLWGVGHTIPILLVGLAVILLRVQIGERVGLSLEFCVGLMLIGLGAYALWRLLRGEQLHLHTHEHDGHKHVHPHFHHAHKSDDEPHSHHGYKPGWRPLFVGMMHGLAGSAALVPLVVAEIRSPLIGMTYMLIFGLGSIGGMMLMSSLVGLPIHLTASRFSRFNYALRALAGVFSVGFGLFMVYEIGFREGLLR